MDISSLQAGVSSASALANLVIVSPKNTVGYQPQAPNGTTAALQPRLMFHYEGENSVNLQSDITDHYIENNTAIQDQITLKPVTITVHGYIGDLNNVPPNTALLTAQTVANKLLIMSTYTPALSITALEAYNAAVEAYQTVASAANSAVSVYQGLSGGQGLAVVNGNGIGITNTTTPGAFNQFTSTQTPQQIMFQQFYGYWWNRVLFTVQTPWAVFQNMAIQTLRSIQDETTQNVTDFEITFKMIRYAQSTITLIGQGRWNQQAAPPVTSQGTVDQTGVPFPGVNYGTASA